MTGASPPSSTSPADILTALKNAVQGVNGLIQSYLNVQGSTNAAALTASTVVKASAGRVARVSVTIAGSSPGTIYDGATLNSTTKQIYEIPNTIGVFEVNIPVNFGIFVTPGTGQTVTVSYS